MRKHFLIFIIALLISSPYSFSQTNDSQKTDSTNSNDYNLKKDPQDPIKVQHSRKNFDDSRKTKKISLDFLGYVKLIGGLDWGNIQNTSEFYPSKIPIYPTEREQEPRMFLDPRQSRLAVDGRYEVTEKGEMHVYLEIDFYNTEAETSFVPHLRHAYGEYRGFLLGQTWSTMKNTAAFPVQVDFEGPNSIPGPRNPMVRYTHTFRQKFTIAAALETHAEDYTQFPENPDETMGFQYIPDLVAFIQKSGNWGNIRLSGILRKVTYTNKGSDGISSLNGWGAEASGIVKFFNRRGISDDIRFGFTYGDGIAYYFSDLRGMGLDAAPNQDSVMTTIPVMGGYVAYKHAWNAKSTSSAVFSMTGINNSDFVGDNMYYYSTYGAINYIWSPLDRLDFGLELIYGKNVNKVEDFGEGYRLQFMAIYHF